MHIETIVNPGYTSNTYVISDVPVTNEVVVIDPGGDGTEIIRCLGDNNFIPHYIILTHEHFDHISGVNLLKETFPAAVLVCSSLCAQKIIDSKKNLSAFKGCPYISVPADRTINEDKETLIWSKETIDCMPWGGHSEGGMFIMLGNVLFCGDQFIKDVKTVTNLPGSKKELVIESLDFLRSAFSPDMVIYPGHGQVIVLKELSIYK